MTTVLYRQKNTVAYIAVLLRGLDTLGSKYMGETVMKQSLGRVLND